VKKLAVTGAFVLILGRVAAGAAFVGPAVDPGRVHAWSPQYMDGASPQTLAQALSAARSFDVIVALERVYQPYVSQMKAANPSLQLFAYEKGMFVYAGNLPESAYSHDASGRRVRGVEFAGTYLLNPLSSDALSYQVAQAKQGLKTSGYDGVFLDTLGLAALNPTFVSSMPVDPRTGHAWTAVAWMAATAAMAGKTATAVGKPVVGNGLRDGKNYFDPSVLTRQLLRGLDGGMAEAWLRGAKNPIGSYPSEAVWKENVDMLADAGALGGSVLAVTKVWTNGSQAQKDAWYAFALASFLLGSDGHSYLSFSYAPGDATVAYPWNAVDLGKPSAPYSKSSNVYQRSFAGGRVLVNPTATTYTVKLGKTFHTLDGRAVNSVTLGADAAVVLTT
jgi:hypothetical protein